MKNLFVLTAVAFAAVAIPARVNAATLNFANLGTATTPTLTVGGLTVTGSANIMLTNGDGLGVVGGINDSTIDFGESVEFTFAGLARDVSLFIPFTADMDGDAGRGESLVEIFAPGGQSLGVFGFGGDLTFSISALVGNESIRGFRWDAFDTLRVGSITFDLAPVPAPPAVALFASGLAAVGWLARRRKKPAA